MARKRQQQPLIIHYFRIIPAILLLIHGVMRMYTNSVDDFGLFLEARNFPMPEVLAWGITLFEIVGSLILMIGQWALILSLLFAMELSLGIYLVHWKEGWFVVGLGRNGMEYSALLICNLLAIAWAYYRKK